MNVTYDYSGCVAVVTGAARGVGRVTLRAFTGAGARVVAADRDPAGLAETCAAVPAEMVAAVVADVSTEAGAAAITGQARSAFGRLDFCVNNAAVAPHAVLLDERAAVWDTVYGSTAAAPS